MTEYAAAAATLGGLRAYQQDMLGRIRRSWAHGRRSVMCQMPTGTGKTLVAVAVIAEFLGAKAGKTIVDTKADKTTEAGGPGGMGRVLVVAHRRELVSQIRRAVRRYGLPEGRVSVRSIQELAAKCRKQENGEDGLSDVENRRANGAEGRARGAEALLEKGRGRPQEGYGLVIVDEAHHAVAATYAMLWRRWPAALFLGLTATPCRLGGEGFAGLFDALLTSWPVEKFIAEGWLAAYDYVSVRETHGMQRRVASLRRRGADGDYQVREMAMVLDTEESVAQLYEAYRTFARGKKGIIYAINRAHARHICDYYAARGVRIAAIDSGTPAAERQEIVARYEGGICNREGSIIYNRNGASGSGATMEARVERPEETPEGGAAGALDVLVNVDIFSEGYDCPSVEFVQLARPTLSLSKYLQQVGRGLRIGAGKRAVTIIDNVGLYRTFGLPSAEREWMAYYLGERRGLGDPEKAAAVGPAVAAERMSGTEDWERALAAQELEIVVRSTEFGRPPEGDGERVESLSEGLGRIVQAAAMSPRRVLPDGRLLAHEERPEVVAMEQMAGRYAVVRWRLRGAEAYAVLERTDGVMARKGDGTEGEASSVVWRDLYERLGRDFPMRPRLAGDDLLRVQYVEEGQQKDEGCGEASEAFGVSEAFGAFDPSGSDVAASAALSLPLEALTWYIDLRSGEEYAYRPRPVRWDFVEALEDVNGECRLRVPEAKGRADCRFRREEVRLNGDVWMAGRWLVHRSMPGRVFRWTGYDAAGNKRLEALSGGRYVMRPGFAPQAVGGRRGAKG